MERLKLLVMVRVLDIRVSDDIIEFMTEYKRTKVLGNLELITAKMEAPSVTVLSMIRAGSRDEFDGKYGSAHFLEHFVFKGTKKYPKVNDVTKAVDGIGGRQNAFTWTDFTGYWVKVGINHIDIAVDVVGQMVSEPLLPESEIEKEKGTIVEEIKMGEDHLPSKSWQKYEELVFESSSLGRPIIGFEETVKSMKTEDLKNFMNRWYTKDNMVIVVAGGIKDHDSVASKVEQAFGSLRDKSEVNNRNGYDEVFTQGSPRVNIVDKKSEQTHLTMGMRTFAADDDRTTTLSVLTTLLGGNMSSRLWDEVREKRGLAYYIRAGYEGHQDQGSFYVRAGVRNKDALEAVKVINNELYKLVSTKVGDDELILAKEALKGNMYLDMEDSMEVAEDVADQWATCKGVIESPEEIVAKIDKVSLDDIQRLSVELFRPEQMNLSLVGPHKDKEVFEDVLK